MIRYINFLFRFMRIFKLKLDGVNIDFSSKVESKVEIKGDVKIGKRSYIGPYCNFRGNVQIGNYFLCADNVHLVGGDHLYSEVGTPIIDTGRDKELYGRKTIIGDDVWLGRNVTIMRGVVIGSGSIIGAGSVVTKSIEEFSIYGGIPAKKIGERFQNKDENLAHLNKIGKI